MAIDRPPITAILPDMLAVLMILEGPLERVFCTLYADLVDMFIVWSM